MGHGPGALETLAVTERFWSRKRVLLTGNTDRGFVQRMMAAGARGVQQKREPPSAFLKAIEVVLAEGPRTPDMGGRANTIDVGRAVADAVSSL